MPNLPSNNWPPDQFGGRQSVQLGTGRVNCAPMAVVVGKMGSLVLSVDRNRPVAMGSLIREMGAKLR